MKIRIKKLNANAILPRKATQGAAAYDIACPDERWIANGRNILPLNFAIELPSGYEAKIEPRSGYASKGFEDSHGIRHDADVLVGKIDSDYRGNVGVIVHNRGNEFPISRGQRIAQMTIYRVEDADFEESDELSETSRGTGGYGSTGK